MKQQSRNHANRKLSESDGAPAKPTGAVSGTFVTEAFEYDGGRQVTVYVPPDPPKAIVFAGDGQGISKWGPSLGKADVPSTMIVGIHGLADETIRVAGTQEPFFLENARRWADALRNEHADVVIYERDGSHGAAFWQEEFPLMVAWAFRR